VESTPVWLPVQPAVEEPQPCSLLRNRATLNWKSRA
jgi:hypothetical protein